MRRVRRQYSVVADKVAAWPRNERSQPRKKIQGLEHEVRRAVTVGRLQLVDDLPHAIRTQPFERQRGPGDVATQPLDALALVRRKCDGGVERESIA